MGNKSETEYICGIFCFFFLLVIFVGLMRSDLVQVCMLFGGYGTQRKKEKLSSFSLLLLKLSFGSWVLAFAFSFSDFERHKS